MAEVIPIEKQEKEEVLHAEVIVEEENKPQEKNVCVFLTEFVLVFTACIALILMGYIGFHHGNNLLMRHRLPASPPKPLVVETVTTCFVMLDPFEMEPTAVLCTQLTPQVGFIHPLPYPRIKKCQNAPCVERQGVYHHKSLPMKRY